jgi:hypothetical protein
MTAFDRPLTSCRECPPDPPPCSPFFAAGGARYFSGSSNLQLAGCVVWGVTQHLSQSNRRRSMPAAAADAGSNASETSIHAHTLSSRVMRARNERAIEVRLEHSGPTNSLRAPCGSPPFSNSSRTRIPVECTALLIFGAGVRAGGILFSRAASTWRRTVAAENVSFAIYSPWMRRNVSHDCTINGASEHPNN